MLPPSPLPPSAEAPCQACGACCSFSASWPRFSLEDDDALAQIPDRFVAADQSGMRCVGERCSALAGQVGQATACLIYEMRPDVCAACMPGGEDCRMARERFGMTALDEMSAAAGPTPDAERLQ